MMMMLLLLLLPNSTLILRSAGIKTERCGKLIVATAESELPALTALYERGKANNVPDLTLLNQSQLQQHEPYSTGLSAIHCATTGIVDYTQVDDTSATVVVVVVIHTVNR